MSDADVDGAPSNDEYTWFEYAVRRPGAVGNALGPLSRQEAARLASEIGGTVIRRRITHSAWAIA
ncbi:hypothetical protein [Microbacterium sp. JZ31]|uniref:hypothetical protein n=1 Tax=Microbacterium sp. JZ31 TaxID=1906274 RepID=UPI001933FEB6|nr:hypothetical protein [Microbacterium sp. JZ31]